MVPLALAGHALTLLDVVFLRGASDTRTVGQAGDTVGEVTAYQALIEIRVIIVILYAF